MPIVRSRYGRNLPLDVQLAEEALLNDVLVNGGAVVNFSRYDATANVAALSTGVMTSVAVPLTEGKVVSSITFVSGTTAAGTPTAYWFGLYDGDGKLLGQSADQVNAAWAANSAKTLALATPVRVPATGVYYAAVMVAATTPPSLAGLTLNNVVLAGALGVGMEVLAQTSGTGLTATAPATIATPSAIAAVPFVALT